jgi:microsomal dipeptidase-like Zn-dependent dipeptidase
MVSFAAMGAWTQSANNDYIPEMNYIVFGLLIVSIGSDFLAINLQIRKIKQVRKVLQTTDDDLL